MAVIAIEDIAHVRFGAPDLAAMQGFLEDFGLRCREAGGRLYARGLDGRPFCHAIEPGTPGFRSLGLRAAALADVERLAASEGVSVEPLAARSAARLPPQRSRS